MKVCILTHTFPRFSGDTAAPFMGELAEALVKEGHNVFVLAPFDKRINNKLRRDFKLITYKYIFPDSLHLLGYSRTLEDDKKIKLSNILLSPFLYLFAFIALLKLVSKEKIDIVSAHWVIPNGFIAAFVSLISKVPFTVTIPGSDIYMAGKNFFFKWMAGFAGKKADYVISDSPYYFEQLNKLGFFPEKTEIIRYGVNSHKFVLKEKDTTLLEKLKIKNEKVLLAVGRFVAKKGFKYLIEAMPEVLSQFPQTKLILVGDGTQRAELEEKTEKLGIGNKIIFAGTVGYNDLQKYYNLADIFVMPSIKDQKGNIDASPVTLMIALMSGCPIVATKYAIGQETVNEAIGYLVKDKNSRQISKAIISLLKKDINYKTREVIRRFAVENFSSEESARKYISIFREILK